MSWSFDISAAPRGRHETRTRVVNGKTHEHAVFIPERILIAHPRDGQVYATYWIEPNKFCPTGRWSGWCAGDEPLAWQAFPAHPGVTRSKAMDDLIASSADELFPSHTDAFAEVKAKSRLANAASVEPSVCDFPQIDDVGSV